MRPLIGQVFLVTALVPVAALAQIQVYQFDGQNEKPVGSTFAVGTAAPGDTIETRFRARNMGQGPAIFQTLALSGQAFRISSAPSLPYTIAPGNEAEFRVVFSPTTPGSYPASLAVNGIAISLQGVSVATASLLPLGSTTPLAAGAVIDFGSAVPGTSQTRSFLLLNSGSTSVTVQTLSVSGTGFRGPIGLAAPVSLAAGQTASFQIAFEPQNGQAAQGTLTVDARIFNLTGQGLDPPLPSASIALSSTVGASAQQNSVSIPLAAVSAISATGTLSMDFRPSLAGVSDDPAVQFLSGPKRLASVTVSPGDSAAKLAGQSSMAFQMGTTAGTIVFTLKLSNGFQQQTNLTIAPEAVNFDGVSGIRKLAELDVSLTGFDNTYSVSQMTFTFYSAGGAAISPGAIQVNVGPAFQQYFAATPVGGMFALLAKFPMSGDPNQVASVDIQITNAAGVTTEHAVSLQDSILN